MDSFCNNSSSSDVNVIPFDTTPAAEEAKVKPGPVRFVLPNNGFPSDVMVGVAKMGFVLLVVLVVVVDGCNGLI